MKAKDSRVTIAIIYVKIAYKGTCQKRGAGIEKSIKDAIILSE